LEHTQRSCKKPGIGGTIKLLCALGFLFFSTPAWAQQNGSFSEPTDAGSAVTTQNQDRIETLAGAIPFLNWPLDEISVSRSGQLSVATVKGTLLHSIHSLKLNDFEIPVQENGSFEIRFTFPQEEKIFNLTVVDENQKIYRAKYRLTHASLAVVPGRAPEKTRFSLGIGYTNLEYNQNLIPRFTEKMVTVKGGLAYFFVPDKWDISLGSFLNLFAIQNGGQYLVQYLGINAKIGYHFFSAPDSFRFNLNAGIYYNTTFSAIGFQNVYGPQLYPEFGYVFTGGQALMFYGKFSPVVNNSTVDFRRNFEVATGTNYSFPITKKNRLSFALDLSRLDLSSNANSAETQTASFSVGISF
jgi:hypothetical protein